LKTASLKAMDIDQIAKNNEFLNLIILRRSLKNDAALARLLEVAPPVISKMRSGTLSVGAMIMVKVLELEVMVIKEIRLFIPR